MNIAGEIVVDIGLSGKCDIDCNANFLNANAKSFSKLPPTMVRRGREYMQYGKVISGLAESLCQSFVPDLDRKSACLL